MTEAELEKVNDILARPTGKAYDIFKNISYLITFSYFVDYNIPKWFLNRQRDIRDGTWSQLISNALDTKLREDLERLKKIRAHRGLRHFWGVKVRGQHTKATGRTGRTLGVARKK